MPASSARRWSSRGDRRHRLAHQLLRRFLEQAVGLPGGVAGDGAGRRVAVSLVMPAACERLAVDPRTVAVEADERGRPVGQCGVELRARRQSAGERRVVPAAAADPRDRRVLRREVADALLHVVERAGATQVELVQAWRSAQEVDVAVVEAGDDGTPGGIDHYRGGPAQRFDRLPCAHRGDAIAGDRHRLGDGLARASEDRAIDHDEVGARRLRSIAPGPATPIAAASAVSTAARTIHGLSTIDVTARLRVGLQRSRFRVGPHPTRAPDVIFLRGHVQNLRGWQPQHQHAMFP